MTGDEQPGGGALQRNGGGSSSVENTWSDQDRIGSGVAPLVWDDGIRRLEPNEGLEGLTPSFTTRFVKDSIERETECPALVLVCAECREYHEYDGEWEVCPKCGEGLIEVDRA